MTTLADLHRTVTATVTGKRLGQPVFVRFHLQGILSAEGRDVRTALDGIVDLVSGWIGQPLKTRFAVPPGKQPQAHAALLLEFAGGATALVSAAAGPRERWGADLMLLGNKGALYHAYDPGSLYRWEESTAPLPATPQPPQPKATVKYGVLLVTGSHTHQENYGAAFAADPRCKIVAVTDEPDVDQRRRQLNERLADVFGVPYLPDLGKALERKDVHIVSICAPPERRGRIAVRCAEAGKHLYLDKSLVPKQAEADALVAAVRKAGVRSHMFTLVTQPWAREAKQFWQSGKLGTPLALHADVLFAKGKTGTAKLGTRRKEEYPPERHQLVEAKREFDNVGVYPITMIRWLTGKKFRTVYGLTANYFFAEHQKHNVEDFGLLAGTLEDGLPVTISAGRCGWTTHPAGGVTRLVLVGSERTLIADANRSRLEVSTDETPWVPPNVNPADPMGFWSSTMQEVHLQPKRSWVPLAPAAASDAGYFVDCLEAGRDSELSVSEAALAAEVLLATYRSAATGEVVTLSR